MQSPVPRRPPRWQERIGMGLFLALSPRLSRTPQTEPPEPFAPFEEIAVPRPDGPGPLPADWYPARTTARGAVLLLHPWLVWGRAYFHRRSRIEALRAAGYHVLAPDLGGFGGSARPAGFFDRDVEACLAELQRRSGGLPLHVWGVSAGGYWAHPVLARTAIVTGAVFEDVSAHLLEWAWRTAPLGRPFYFFYRTVLSEAYRYLDIRLHAAAMSVKAVTYISGELDRGVRPQDTLALAEAAGGRHLVVPGADHLGAIKSAEREVISLALDTFRRAEEGGGSSPGHPAR